VDGEAVTGGLRPPGTSSSCRPPAAQPGSVGQPRDGDHARAWLLLDLERRFANFRRVAYPIEKTQDEMRERAAPALAARLERANEGRRLSRDEDV
jgi:diadenosine tetraphosphatase ApaH/serine/threonine PP2A family protein phosphatase